jgi:hypothetical protein
MTIVFCIREIYSRTFEALPQTTINRALQRAG